MRLLKNRWAWCVALASGVVYVGLTVVPAVVMSGCFTSDAVIYCKEKKDSGANDGTGGTGGAGGAGGADPATCP